eukprot:gene22137-26680_t
MRSNLGYLGNPAATTAAFPVGDEWFDTGDLGYICPDVALSKMRGQLVITGRDKDVIVLSNGENIMPEPIELACVQSPHIKQIMVVATPDDKHLAAFVVPDFDGIDGIAKSHGLASSRPSVNAGKVDEHEWLHRLLLGEVNMLNRSRQGYLPMEEVKLICIIENPFTVENGLLGNTMKIKRYEVLKKYPIHEFFNGPQ